ncbi:MAG: VCBS repeat-containing protein [Sedimentisphaerales bacterium]|nr:VCBS repeat-containing protein [Sedimentisphaerales bacterium]
MLKILILISAGLISTEITGLSRELEQPVRLEAAGKPIDTDVGHAAPFVCDFDGDGVKDLLVGQFGGGALWIYRNEGTNSQPKLAAGVKFKDGKEDGCVPSG